MRSAILVLNWLRSGGAEKQLLWVACELRAAGYACYVVELSACTGRTPIDALVERAEAAGVRFLRAARYPTFAMRVLALRRLCRETWPVLVWSWGLRADIACALNRGAFAKKATWLVSVRSANAHLSLSTRLVQQCIATLCDGAVSNTRAGFMTSGFRRVKKGRRWILPNAVPVSAEAPTGLPDVTPDRLIVLMLGNIMVYTKGYDIAVAVAKRLSDRGVRFEIRIAGRPDDILLLASEAEKCGVQQHLHYVGEVGQPGEFLRTGHLFLLLSRFEGMPNTLLEALNAGLPAIATDVGDLRFLKEQGAPFEIVPIEDVAAAADAIERALVNWSETREAAGKGRSWVQANFSEDVCRTFLRRILKEVLES